MLVFVHVNIARGVVCDKLEKNDRISHACKAFVLMCIHDLCGLYCAQGRGVEEQELGSAPDEDAEGIRIL